MKPPIHKVKAMLSSEGSKLGILDKKSLLKKQELGENIKSIKKSLQKKNPSVKKR